VPASVAAFSSFPFLSDAGQAEARSPVDAIRAPAYLSTKDGYGSWGCSFGADEQFTSEAVLMGIRAVVDTLLWGDAWVSCEECGRLSAAHQAVWRGAHPYCSAAHEWQDHRGPGVARA